MSNLSDVKDAAFRHWLAALEWQALMLKGVSEDDAAEQSRLDETADETKTAAERVWNGSSSLLDKMQAMITITAAGLDVPPAVIEGIAAQHVPI